MSAVVGLFYGVAATVGQAYRLGGFPLGLVLAVVGSAGLLIAMRALTADRWNALAASLGLIGATALFSQVGPGGSAIVAAPTPDTAWIAIAWTFAGPVLAALVVAWPDVSAPRVVPPRAP